MIDLSPLARRLAGSPLAEWANTLQAQLDTKMEKGHGDLERWQSALDALPDVRPTHIDLLDGLTLDTDCDDQTRAQMRQALMGLSPWRKGPFDLFGVHVDTEWHSDWKWSRVAPHINLKHKRILDVGCGNGYYMWRMLGAGAHSVIGVDPNWLFFCQFQAVQRFLQQEAVWHLPFPFEDLPANLEGFDTVFSMGVFYHRRSPIEHLLALKDCLVASWYWKPWWSKATSIKCWCQKTVMRKCATCGFCPPFQPWSAGYAAQVSATCGVWM